MVVPFFVVAGIKSKPRSVQGLFVKMVVTDINKKNDFRHTGVIPVCRGVLRGVLGCVGVC